MNDLKQRLSADHDELERQLRELARAIATNDAASDLHQCENGTRYVWINDEEHRHLLRPLLAMFGRHRARRGTDSAGSAGTRSSTS